MTDAISRKEVSKFQLAVALFTPINEANLTLVGKQFVTITEIQKEDGSGNRFNVRGYLANGSYLTFYVETLD